MAEPFGRLVDDLPPERRERIETQTQALIEEYELLKVLRRDRQVSQEQLAELMGIRQASVSKIENQADMRLSTLRKYVEALGGQLEVRVRFPDREVRLDPLLPRVPWAEELRGGSGFLPPKVKQGLT